MTMNDAAQGETRDERGAFCAGVSVPTLFGGSLTERGYVCLIPFGKL